MFGAVERALLRRLDDRERGVGEVLGDPPDAGGVVLVAQSRVDGLLGEVGHLELTCQTLLDPDQSHILLVYTAVPGSESHEKLRLLSVIGPHHLAR
ncbi:hypothetical protein GCM10027436_51650 [Actinophytocola sediminis]